MGIEERGTIIRGYVDGGSKLPCFDASTSGYSSGSGPLSCAYMKSYCAHSNYGSTVTNNCPVTCQKAGCESTAAPAATNAASAATTMTVTTAPPTTTTTATTTSTTTTTTTTATAAAQECVDGASSGVSSRGSTLTCSQVKAYCSHGTYGNLISSNCPVTCQKAKAGCLLPVATCEDGSTSGASSGGRALTCSQVKPYCNHAGLGSLITGNCPKTCGACS